MKTLRVSRLVLLLSLGSFMGEMDSHGHSINYQVLEKGIALRAFYSERDPSSSATLKGKLVGEATGSVNTRAIPKRTFSKSARL